MQLISLCFGSSLDAGIVSRQRGSAGLTQLGAQSQFHIAGGHTGANQIRGTAPPTFTIVRAETRCDRQHFIIA